MGWSGRWIFFTVMVFWAVQRFIGINLWSVFGIMFIFYWMFGSDIIRWFNANSDADAEKRKNHLYEQVKPANLTMNDDGLPRRIVQASDGEFLVAVEDPETGMLYLDENKTII